MEKGQTITANCTSKLWDIISGEKLIALSDEKFYNGEHQILTIKGWLPSVFFYNLENELYTIECYNNDGELIASFEENLPMMSSAELKIWRLTKGITAISKQIGGLKGQLIVYKVNGKEVNF